MPSLAEQLGYGEDNEGFFRIINGKKFRPLDFVNGRSVCLDSREIERRKLLKERQGGYTWPNRWTDETTFIPPSRIEQKLKKPAAPLTVTNNISTAPSFNIKEWVKAHSPWRR